MRGSSSKTEPRLHQKLRAYSSWKVTVQPKDETTTLCVCSLYCIYIYIYIGLWVWPPAATTAPRPGASLAGTFARQTGKVCVGPSPPECPWPITIQQQFQLPFLGCWLKLENGTLACMKMCKLPCPVLEGCTHTPHEHLHIQTHSHVHTHSHWDLRRHA